MSDASVSNGHSNTDAVINITDNLEIWEGVALRPAVIDRSAASTTVGSPTVRVRSEVAPFEPSINTEQEGVFTVDDSETVEFSFSGRNGAATSDFDGDNLRVLVAHIDPDA
ncbi:hypothetical protein BN903_178 [Halorubrum sp. AJ67]|nr:hypothetical protein BN903_178 [Halorubrum sp. AJ67]